MSDEMSRKKEELQKADHVDDLEHAIHQKKPLDEEDTHIESTLKKERFSTPKDWSALHEKEYEVIDKNQALMSGKKTSIYKKFFMFSIVFFLIAIAIVGLMSLSGKNKVSLDNIDIKIAGNNFVEGGEELVLGVDISNGNILDLELVDLIVYYYKGGAEKDEVKTTKRISLGSISAGETRSEEIRLILFGERESEKDITFELEYRTEGSNSIFVKEVHYPVLITSAPVGLKVVGPASIGPNQSVTFDIEVTSQSESVLRNMTVEAIYPPGFQFIEAIPVPDVEKKFWSIESISPFETKTITVTGVVNGQEGESRFIKAKVGESNSRSRGIVTTAYNTIVHEISILRPFLEVDFALNGDRGKEVIANGGRAINAYIGWLNNLDTSLEDVELTVSFSGNAFDDREVKPQQGFYSNADKTIVWDRSSVSQFISIEPNGRGNLQFQFTPLQLSNTEETIIDPEILVEISMRGRFKGEDTFEEIKNFKQTLVSFNTDAHILARGQHFEGPIKNSGPTPPRANEETTYTIIYDITNSSNPISDVEVRTTLPTNVNFTNVIAPSYESVTFNESSREVVWRIDGVSAGVGSSSPPREVAFQVAVTPSINDIGNEVPLTGDILMTFTDTKTKEKLSQIKDPITTDLRNDVGYTAGEVE